MTAAQLPGEIAAQSGLATRIARELGATSHLLDPAEAVTALSDRLAAAGSAKKAIALLRALLHLEVRTIPSGQEWLPDWPHGRFRHNEHGSTAAPG